MEAQHLDEFKKAKLALKNRQISSLRYQPGSELHQIDKARIEILETRNSDLRVIAGQLYIENEENRTEREFEFSSAAKMRRERNWFPKIITGQNTEIVQLRQLNDRHKQGNNLSNQNNDLYRQKHESYEILHNFQKIMIDTQAAECQEFQRKLDNLDLDWEISQKNEDSTMPSILVGTPGGISH